MSRFWDRADQVVFRTEKDRVLAGDNLADPLKPPQDGPHRLTSTVTCLESLLEGPYSADGPDVEFSPAWAQQALVEFMNRSLTKTTRWETDSDNDRIGWQSDKAAWVYCRVRTLGGALRLIDGGITAFGADKQQLAQELVRQAWASRDDRGGSFGLRELTIAPGDTSTDERAKEDRYPPNAFLTYWGLLAAHGLGSNADSVVTEKERSAAFDWLRANLGFQIALHYIGSSQADPQQLAWSLCGLVRFGTPGVLSNSVSADRQLLIAGLRAFFEQQHEGTWKTGAPLFHFRTAGNAYAYIYETLAELLSLATSKAVEQSAATALAAALREHSQELLLALEHAEQTSQRLGDQSLGWNSGHHPHRDSPESWATASVYRFAQGLRRLFGLWSSASAKAFLDARRARGDLNTLGERGQTWNLGHGTVGQILAMTYVHPACLSQLRMESNTRFYHDPDQRILGEEQARSAMLFGPPGTGKTKLVECVAAAIGWDFIEITPAQFLDQGVDHVSARADAIFRQIMEIDRCVILFDEIDELIRTRNKEAESIERFFTTTMLPRLAKMWESRRVMFFVNTNNIAEVDNAIARSQRFDALIFVLPPNYEKKKAMLSNAGIALAVDEDTITNALIDHEKVAEASKKTGWFAVIRHDQMGALISQLSSDAPVTGEVLINAMRFIAAELAHLDWNAHLIGDTENGELMDKALPDVKALYKFERMDPRIWQCARIDDAGVTPPKGEVREAGGSRWIVVKDMTTTDPQKWARELGFQLTTEGVLVPPNNS